MANTVVVNVIGDTKNLQRAMSQANASLGKLGQASNKAGRIMASSFKVAAAGAVVLGVALYKVGKSSIELASAAEQSLGGTEAIFGKFSKSIIKNSNHAAERLGLSANDYRESANQIGALFKNAGVPMDQLAGKTDNLIGRAGDLAAMFGGPVSEAADSLTAAFKGEFDRLEKYGISIKQADVNTLLLARGQDKLTGKSKKLATQQAITDLIFKQSADSLGAADREHNTFASTMQRLQAKIQNVQVKIGRALMPIIMQLMGYLEKKGVPALKRFADWFKKEGPAAIDKGVKAVKDFWNTIKPLVMFVLQHLSTFAKLTAAFYALTTAIAIVNPLVKAATAYQAAYNAVLLISQRTMGTLPAGATTATGAIGKLGAAARMAAGAAGIGLLIDALHGASDEGASFGDVLEGAAGGAGIGAMFGPIGALIGGGIGGGLTALKGAFAQTAEEAEAARIELLKTEGFKEAQKDAESLSEALNGVLNKYGAIPREAVKASFFGPDGLDSDIQTMRDAGLSLDTMIDAALGSPAALKVVDQAMSKTFQNTKDAFEVADQAWKEAKDGWIDLPGVGPVQVSDEQMQQLTKTRQDAKDKLDELNVSQDTWNHRIGENNAAVREHNQLMRDLANTLGLTIEQYKAWPKNVRTKIEADGLPQTAQGALRLIGQFKGLQNFKRIKTVISAPGVDLSRKQIHELQKRYNLTPRQVRTLIRVEGANKARTDTEKVNERLRETGNVKPTTRNWTKWLERDMGNAQDRAQNKRKAIDAVLNDTGKTTTPDLGKFMSTLVSDLKTVASNAHTGGLSIGTNLKSGVITGFSGTQSQLSTMAAAAVRGAVAAAKAAGDIHSPSRKMMHIGQMLVKGLIKGFDDGRGGVKSAIEKAMGDVEKYLNKMFPKNDKRVRNTLKHVKKAMDDETKALLKNAKRREKIYKQLERAQDQLRAKQDQYKAYKDAIIDGVLGYTNVTNLDTAFNADAMVKQLEHRLEKVRRFTAVIKDLIAKGLNKTMIDQLVQAGVEGGLATAVAIDDGGQAAIDEFNQLQGEINSVAGDLGTTAANDMYEAGLKAAEGLVKGLQAKKKELERWAKQLARDLAKAIRKALGIHSPSRVFMDIGKQTVKGLQIGLEDTTGVRHAVTKLGNVMEAGFNPTLSTSAISGNGPTAHTVNINVAVPPTADKAAIGREVQSTLDAYYRKGGKPAAV